MNIKRHLIRLGSGVLAFPVAKKAAKYFLATQGIGFATDVEDSGELIAAKRLLLPGSVVFDIGAHTGSFSAGLLGLSCSFHLFEPSADHFARLQERFRDSKRVKLNRFGLSSEASTLTLHKDQAISGLASLLDRDLSHINTPLSIHESVEVRTGDEYCRAHGIDSIDYMKIDVEGWEMPVLVGFREKFTGRQVRACQFEFGHAHMERRENFRDFYRWFASNSYTLHVIKPNGALNAIGHYDEIYENYYASNFLALAQR